MVHVECVYEVVLKRLICATGFGVYNTIYYHRCFWKMILLPFWAEEEIAIQTDQETSTEFFIQQNSKFWILTFLSDKACLCTVRTDWLREICLQPIVLDL